MNLDSLVLIGVRIPKEFKQYLKVKAAKQDSSVQALVTEAISQWIEKNEKEDK